MIMTSDGIYLTGLWFEGSGEMEKFEVESPDQTFAVFRETERWLDLYFGGRIPDFVPEYKIENLTPFRQEVVEVLKTIEYGRTLTYGDIAKRLAVKRGIPRMSAQAVGGAVGWNPICIIIPCHRVIGADGSLTGYGGGILNKAALLRHEGLTPTNTYFS